MLLAILAAPLRSRAEPERDPQAALVEFERAQHAYRAGDWETAAQALEAALTHDPLSPTLHYNLGRVYERLNNPENALESYRLHLTLLKDEDARSKARALAAIARLEKAIEETSTANAPEEVSAVPSPEHTAPALEPLPSLEAEPLDMGLQASPSSAQRQRRYRRINWGLAAASLVAATVGAGLYVGAARKRSDADALVLGIDGTQADRDALLSRANALGLGGDIAIGVAGGFALAALLHWWLAGPEAAE